MAKKDVAAVEILVTGLTCRGTAFNKGQVVFESDDHPGFAELVECANKKGRSRDGKLLCRVLNGKEALRAAKRADDGKLPGAMIDLNAGQEEPNFTGAIIPPSVIDDDGDAEDTGDDDTGGDAGSDEGGEE